MNFHMMRSTSLSQIEIWNLGAPVLTLKPLQKTRPKLWKWCKIFKSELHPYSESEIRKFYSWSIDCVDKFALSISWMLFTSGQYFLKVSGQTNLRFSDRFCFGWFAWLFDDNLIRNANDFHWCEALLCRKSKSGKLGHLWWLWKLCRKQDQNFENDEKSSNPSFIRILIAKWKSFILQILIV